MNKFLTILASLLLLARQGSTQSFPVLRYGVEDGLPSNTVYSIYRDSKGFLWMGTNKGVARYNGIKYEVFSSADGLPDKDIFFFVEDDYGRVWLATYNGELCYYQNGVFHNRINTPFLDVKTKFSDIRFINKEKDSSITICFSGCMRFLNIKKETVKLIDLANKQNLDYFSTQRDISTARGFFSHPFFIFIGKTNAKSYHLESGSLDFDVDAGGYIKKITDKVRRGSGITQGMCIQYDSFGIYGFNKPYKFRKTTNDILLTGQAQNVTQIYHDSINYFICTRENLRIADSGIIFNRAGISGVIQDNIGNYWLSTLDTGIFFFSKYFGKQEMVRNAYSGRIMYSCIRKGMPFFVDVKSNVFCLDNGKIKKLLSAGDAHLGQEERAYYITDDLDLYYNTEWDIRRVENILASRPKVNSLGHKDRFGIKAFFVKGEYFYMYIINAIVRCPVSISNSRWFNYRNFIVSDSPNSRIYHAALSPEGNVWYTKMAGTFKIDDDKSRLQKQFDKYSLRSMAFAGSYMVSVTQNNKLIVCNRYQASPIIDTIPDGHCMWDKLQVIDSAHLLIGTNNQYRIMTLFPSTGKPEYSVTTIENQLMPLDAESICADSKNCYFFKNGNIYTFDLQSLFTRSEPPKLFFNNIKTAQHSYVIGSRVTIPYEEAQNPVVSVSAVSFRAKEIFYEYSISRRGQDVWRPMTGDVLNLVNPRYGTYTIKVRARTSSSKFCTPISFVFRITTPWWATWWFITVSSLIVITSTVLLIRFRLQTLLHRKEREHESKIKFMRSEYKALNALMNPHFIFNTINNLQTLFNTDDKRRANKYLVIFADLIRQNMHNVSKDVISLQKEMDLVANYLLLEKLRFEKLNYTIEVGEDVDLTGIMVPPMLIQPLVENSIKHGILPLKSQDGHIYITISEEENLLHIEIKDNGVGIGKNKAIAPGSAIHESYGLSNIRERIHQLNTIQSNELFFDMYEVMHETTGEHLWTTVSIKIRLS